MIVKTAKWLFLFLQALPVLGGLSMVLTPGVTGTQNAQPMPQQQPWRVEFQLHDWTPASVDTDLWDQNSVAGSVQILSSNILRFNDKRDAISPSTCDLHLAGYSNILVRIQRDPVGMRMVCELWSYDGTGYNRSSATITAFLPWNYGGARFGGANTRASLGFFRIFTTLLPDGSQPPVTASKGDYLDLRFDGDTRDDSGNGLDLTFPSSPGFAATPNQNPVSLIKTAGAPAWSNWVSLRAGYPATLDGTSSFSLADASGSVNYQWQQVSGPTLLRWSSYTSPNPVVKGLIFGTYTFRLQVTDAAGRKAVADLDVGAVATDDNGVVVHANAAADLLFGPMIAFGKNPWQFQDYITLHSAVVRRPGIARLSPPSWINNLSGTVTFRPDYGSTPYQTKIASAISATDTTIVLTDATKLDFSSLPSVIMLNPTGTIEEVRICGASGNVLTVCYDGRGWRRGVYSQQPAPAAWPAGTAVKQLTTTGSGTAFLTDFCPAGPGEEGQISYSAGTVSVTANSTALTGLGTLWTEPPLQGQRIRISGHHAGVPFFFFTAIATVNSPTSITLSRPYPETATSETGLTYAVILSGRQIARNWQRSDGTTGQQLSSISSCEDDTHMYQAVSDSIANNNTSLQTGQSYSYSSTTWSSEFGPNYYDEVLANYASYFRSGYTFFRDSARLIGDYWPTMPEIDQGFAGGFPRHLGVTGMVAGAVLDGRTNNWYAIRKLANNAVAGPYSGGAILSSCDTDVREDAYGLSWIALAAMFDPVDAGNSQDPNQRSYWKAQLDRAYTRDSGCIVNSVFSQPFYSGDRGTFSLTSGSPVATGTAIPQSLCAVGATGSINVTSGGPLGYGVGLVPGQKIVIQSSRNGHPYLFYSLFTVNADGSATLKTPFDGDSGTYPYQIETDINFLAFATGYSDRANLNTFYTCSWISSTAIMLDRPWEGSTGQFNASRNLSTYVGVGPTPFQIGIKVLATRYASLGATGATASNYRDMSNTLASWILNEGFDPVTGGLYYVRGFYNCEPPGIYKIGCDYGPDPSSKVAARTLSGEAQNAMTLAYQTNPTDATRQFGDQFYGAQWGKPSFGNPPYSDGIYLNTLDSDNTFSYKWIGFLFGIGMSHQWPAARLGGVQPPLIVTLSISFDLAGARNARSAKIKITEPSGAVALFDCAASPCQVQTDARQGAAWYQIVYLDANGNPVSQTRPDLVEVGQGVR